MAAYKLPGVLLALLASMAAAGTNAGNPTMAQWVFSESPTKGGKPICAMSAGPILSSGVNNISIKWAGGGRRVSATLYKDSWDIPRGKTIATTIDFMDNQPLSLPAYGDGKIVDMQIPEQVTYVFLSLVRDSNFLQIGFPKGSEPTWTIPLKGSSAAFKEFVACASRLSKQNTQPF